MKHRLLTTCLLAAGHMLLFAVSSFAQQYPGYTLYSNQSSTSAYLVDTNGTTFHTWTFANNAKTGYSSYMLPGGKLLRTVMNTGNAITGGGVTGTVQLADWSGTLLWSYVHSSSTYVLHHDICPLPNGNVLMIAYEVKTAADATAAGCSQAISIKSEKIIEVQPTGTSGGTIVWEWHAWDHLCQNYNAAKNNYVTSISAHPELLNINFNTTQDWIHMNGIDYNPQLDQIVFSSHSLNEIYVIDHSTTTAQAATHTGGNAGKGGDFLYRWGNPMAYGAGTASNRVLNVVHDAHWIPQGYPKAGWLVGFNNNGVSTSQSSVDMLNPPLSGLNYTLTSAAYSPASYDTRLTCSGHTNNMGSAQQLPNGNSLITIAQSGLIYEVDSNNVTLWSKNTGGPLAQSQRYTACDISGTPPAMPAITANGSVLTSSAAPAGATYQWFKDGVAITGATAQSYTATASGSYQVQILDGYTCGSDLSAGYTYSGGSNAVGNTPLSDEVRIYPNPSNGRLSLDVNKAGDYTVTVLDAYGRLLTSLKNAASIDLAAYANGIYYVSVKGENLNVTRKISLLK